MSPVADPMSVTPSSHVAVFRNESFDLSLLFGIPLGSMSLRSLIYLCSRDHVTWPLIR